MVSEEGAGAWRTWEEAWAGAGNSLEYCEELKEVCCWYWVRLKNVDLGNLIAKEETEGLRPHRQIWL